MNAGKQLDPSPSIERLGRRGSTSRYKLPCGCVMISYSSPEMPFSREAIEKYCDEHRERKAR